MNNAKTDHFGNNKNSRQRKRNQPAPQDCGVRPMDGKTKRRTGNFQGQKEVRTDSHVANGLLNCTFLPKFRQTEMNQVNETSAKLESDFFRSLSRLAEHYKIEPFAKSDNYKFPYNINLAISDIKGKLKKNVLNFHSLRFKKENDKFYVVSEERCDTGATLFYIPVIPLFRMINDKKRKKTAHLLLSVFSYLYHIADIPYYRQEGSYLYYEYEMLKDWIMDDPYEDEEDNRVSEIEIAEWVGDKIEQKIYNRENLTFFDQRIARFDPKDDFDTNCLILAQKTLAIYREYPDASIFRNASSMFDEDEEYLEDQIIPMEKYISFYADNKGWLAETVFESVNNQFQEYSETQEPALIQCFDGQKNESKDLAFEERLFDLLHDLTDLIYDYRQLSDEKQ
ncbi:hypothetical protein DBR39_12645 [Chryseobacterium sp. KBW03]|uniref:hypothetical protein n=1 Tax=Chryseobacterium sp. KBW03 TaxID=2153362 RepID=UPI000F5AEF13|nr:hypothetical protein [Chryseobacterium sp. KBW03]RQO37732.1 hypothetical protein DBR39_12645 [Chryseobacterium sp. KBW03]